MHRVHQRIAVVPCRKKWCMFIGGHGGAKCSMQILRRSFAGGAGERIPVDVTAFRQSALFSGVATRP